jgi:hypothetical protein
MQSMGVFSLNHDTTTSYRLRHHTPFSLKFTPPLRTYYGYKDTPICPSTASQGAKHFVYIQYGCGMQSMGVFSLNKYDTATSYRLGHAPVFLEFTPPCTCNMA